MNREKVFVVTLVTSGAKTDYGINFLTDAFTNFIMAINRFRNSYEAYASEVTDEDKEKIKQIVEMRKK